MSFTFEGRRFLADARKLLADWDASIAGVQDGPLRGPIRMTATQDFGRTEVAPLIDRFLDLHPAVQITLHLSDGVVDLVEQDIDLALRNGPLADSALKARLMLRGRRVVKVPFITVDGVKVADSDLVIGFLKTAFPDPDAGLSDHQRAVGHLVQRTLEDHLYWIALIYEFYDQEGSDWFFEHAFGGIGPGLQGLRDDMEDRTYKQGIARYTPDEIVDKASKDLAAVAEILGENRRCAASARPVRSPRSRLRGRPRSPGN